MRFLSLFSGIEAASMAWLPLGWKCVGVAEIETFPCKVLAHYYPDVPNLGDITKITKEQIDALGHIDLVVGGFPCQDLSIAGKRKGFTNDDGSTTRSGLFYTALQIARWTNARWLLLENVPGIYSSNNGRDFASMAGEILDTEFAVPSNGWQNSGVAASKAGLLEWRTLDAQYFGVPQRRRRMFALADFGDWTSREPVLFERHSLQGHSAPSREKGQEVTKIAGTLSANGGGTTRPAGNANELDFCITDLPSDVVGALCARDFKGVGNQYVQEGKCIPVWPPETAPTLNASFGTKQGLENQHINGGGDYSCQIAKTLVTKTRLDAETETLITHGGYFDNTIAFNWQGSSQQGASISEDVTPTLDKSKVHAVAHAFKVRGGCEGVGKGYLGQDEQAFTLSTGADQQLFHKMQVRRLTPKECERLQGFSDDFTNIPGASDSARYKALGNSFAVPVVRWIGERIEMVENMQKDNRQVA